MIQVIHRALKIMRLIAVAPEVPHNLGDIASMADLNPATCARILRTLVDEGYVEQVGHKKGYILGPMAYTLAGSGNTFRRELVLASEPVLLALAAELDETVLITALNNSRRVVLQQIDGNRDIQVRSSLSQTYNPYASATGRLLMAFLPDRERGILVNSLGLPTTEAWPEITGKSGLEVEFAQIRKHGIAVRHARNVVGIAYPVFAGSRVTGALGCFLPSSRFTGQHKKEVLSALERSAHVITKNLTGENHERQATQGLRQRTRSRSSGHCPH